MPLERNLTELCARASDAMLAEQVYETIKETIHEPPMLVIATLATIIGDIRAGERLRMQREA